MEQKVKEGKSTALVAYLTMVGSLIAMSMNWEERNAFARFHTRQAFGLHLCFLGMALFLSVWFNVYAWYGLYIAFLALWIYGFWGALNYRTNSIPLLGAYFQKWFTFIP